MFVTQLGHITIRWRSFRHISDFQRFFDIFESVSSFRGFSGKYWKKYLKKVYIVKKCPPQAVFFFKKWSKIVIFFTKMIIMNVIPNRSRSWKLTKTIDKLSFQWSWSIHIKNQSIYKQNVLQFSFRFLIWSFFDYFGSFVDHF